MHLKEIYSRLGRFEIVDSSGLESIGIDSAGLDAVGLDSAGLASAGLGFEIYHKNSVGDPILFRFLGAYCSIITNFPIT